MALNVREKIGLFQLRLKARIDSRMTACRVAAAPAGGGTVAVVGYSHYVQTDAFVKTVAQEIFGKDKVGFKLKVMERGAPKFAVVHKAFAQIWRNPDSSDPVTMDTEAVYGTVVRVYHREGNFIFIQHPDGYVGYTPTEALRAVSVQQYLRWKNGEHAITLVPLKAGDVVIPPGSRLSREGGRLLLVDGGILKAGRKEAVVFNPSKADFVTAVTARAEEFMASPYLWGGKTEAGIDCSGFVQTLALQEGIFLPRDASMQCHVGEIVGMTCSPATSCSS
jgi:hypothetical protein